MLEGGRVFGLPSPEFREDAFLENDRLSAGDVELELIASPGHTPDSICFYNPKDKVLISGDVVFEQNTGRVDLPGSSADELKRSIEGLSKLELPQRKEFRYPPYARLVQMESDR